MHHLQPEHRHLVAYDIIDIAASVMKKLPSRRKMFPELVGIYTGGVDYVRKLTPEDRDSAHINWLGVEIDTTHRVPRPHGFVTVKPLTVTTHDNKSNQTIVEGVSVNVATIFCDDTDSWARLYSQGLQAAKKLHPGSTVIATEPLEKFDVGAIDNGTLDNLSPGFRAASLIFPEIVSVGPIHRSDMSMLRKSVFGAVHSI